MTITKSEGKYSLSYTKKDQYGKVKTKSFHQVGDFDFIQDGGDGHRIVIISSTTNLLTVAFYEDYETLKEGESQEYGLCTFMK